MKNEGFSPVPGILWYGDYPPFDPFGAGSSILGPVMVIYRCIIILYVDLPR
jgi:hypothetical protein